MNLIRNHYCYDYEHVADPPMKVLTKQLKRHLKTFSIDDLDVPQKHSNGLMKIENSVTTMKNWEYETTKILL